MNDIENKLQFFCVFSGNIIWILYDWPDHKHSENKLKIVRAPLI